MTDTIITAPITIRRMSVLRIGFPKLRLRSAMAAMPSAVGKAFAMAYVEPYGPRRPSAGEEELQGRDSNW